MYTIDQLPVELLTIIAGAELITVATFRAVLPRRLYRAYNAQVRSIHQYHRPEPGAHVIHQVDLHDFPNLTFVRLCRVPLRELPTSVTELDFYHFKNVICDDPIWSTLVNITSLTLQQYDSDHDLTKLLPSITSLAYHFVRGCDVSHTKIHTFCVSESMYCTKIKLPGTVTRLDLGSSRNPRVTWSSPPKLKLLRILRWDERTQHMKNCLEQHAKVELSENMHDAKYFVDFTMACNHTTKHTFAGLRRLVIDVLLSSIHKNVLPKTLEELLLRRIGHAVVVKGYNLRRLRVLHLVFMRSKNLSFILNDFRNSSMIEHMEIKFCRKEGLDSRIWRKFPNLKIANIFCIDEPITDVPVNGPYYTTQKYWSEY